MTKQTQNRDLQITFIHQFKRATRTAWPDKFRLFWYFNPETLDYVYEHKKEPSERCLLFLLFELQIVGFINSDEVDDGEFENVFGVTKHRYFSAEAIDEWTEQVEIL